MLPVGISLQTMTRIWTVGGFRGRQKSLVRSNRLLDMVTANWVRLPAFAYQMQSWRLRSLVCEMLCGEFYQQEMEHLLGLH